MSVGDIGKRVKEARESFGPGRIRLSDLARAVNISTSRLSNYETGRSDPPYDLAIEIAKQLQVSLDWLLGESRVMRPNPIMFKPVDPDAVSMIVKEAAPAYVQRAASGSTVALPAWRGISAGFAEEVSFEEPAEVTYEEVPFFLIEGDPTNYLIIIPNGTSLVPRIDLGNWVIVKRSTDIIQNVISLVRSPENKHFIKVIKRAGHKIELHSIANGFAPIEITEGWTIIGHAVAIWDKSAQGSKNIEYAGGSPLRI